MTDFKYIGSELELFAAALNWKRYWSQRIRPFVAGDILEVGAGIGSSTLLLDPGGRGRWVCLEPDPRLAAQITGNLRQAPRRCGYEIISGTLQDLDAGQQFNTIIYIDVLEHIADDREELNTAASHLRGGGRIIALLPAYQWLFTPFDAAIGHYRRYSRARCRSMVPASLRIEKLINLDSIGAAASLANLLMLRQSIPTRAQLRFWDQWLVPVSRVLDKVFLYGVGKTILVVWRRRL